MNFPLHQEVPYLSLLLNAIHKPHFHKLKMEKDCYTIAIVTHSMQQASRISDRTAFMLDGNLIEYNDTKSIFLNPEKQETSDYISGKFG